MAQRQTASFLIKRFREVGIRPNTRHGQNFLIDLNLIDLLAEAAEVSQSDVVLEVGTGTGSLTGRLARAAAAVVTAEIDGQLHQLAREELASCDNVTMLRLDALENKNRLNREMLAVIGQRLSEVEGGQFKLVANLPYNIATPLISNLLACDLPPASMTVTIQKELADRIVAGPGTKDYGALSVWVQAQCTAHIVRIMPPTVFWPRPKVESAILRIDLDPARREAIPDLAFLHRFVRALFFHRRKFLRSVVLSAVKKQLDKPAVDEVLQEMELGPDARAEQLDVSAMLRLIELLRQRLATAGHYAEPTG